MSGWGNRRRLSKDSVRLLIGAYNYCTDAHDGAWGKQLAGVKELLGVQAAIEQALHQAGISLNYEVQQQLGYPVKRVKERATC